MKTVRKTAAFTLLAGVVFAGVMPAVERDANDIPSSSGSFSVKLIRNDAFRKNGPAELAWAHAKYGKGLRADDRSRVASGSVDAFNQSYDREYLSPLILGTPGQLCWIDIDTGSGDL